MARIAKMPRRLPELFKGLARIRNWPYVIPTYAGLRRHDPQRHFITRSGIRLRIPTPHDLVTAWVILVRDEYPIPAGCRTVLDVGANIGAFSCLVCRLCPQAEVIAVEPVPSTYRVLLENVAINGMSGRITLVPSGLAAESGRKVIYVSDVSAFSSMFRSPGRADQPLEIETRSLRDLLDVFCKKYPEGCDLLKLDCEGAEHEAILASSAEDLRRIRHIVMEYHPVAPLQPTLEHLLACGFSIVRHDPHGRDLGAIHLERR